MAPAEKWHRWKRNQELTVTLTSGHTVTIMGDVRFKGNAEGYSDWEIEPDMTGTWGRECLMYPPFSAVLCVHTRKQGSGL